jgi:hypothetical protein
MDTMKQLVTNSSLKTNLLTQYIADKQKPRFVDYDEEMDNLYILFVVDPSIPVVLHPMNDSLSVVFDPENLEVVGLEINEFTKEFISRNTSFKKAWQSPKCYDSYGEFVQAIQRQKPQLAYEAALVAKAALGGGRNRPELVHA